MGRFDIMDWVDPKDEVYHLREIVREAGDIFQALEKGKITAEQAVKMWQEV